MFGLVCIEIVQGVLDFGELSGADVSIYFGGFSNGAYPDLQDEAKVYTFVQGDGWQMNA
jgi:hypothetical protein